VPRLYGTRHCERSEAIRILYVIAGGDNSSKTKNDVSKNAKNIKKRWNDLTESYANVAESYGDVEKYSNKIT
jgi:hypothetical protein